MPGFGRPIISFEAQGYRLVAVGNEIRWSTTWVTFVDFLFDYIKAMLTPTWGQAELSKPEAEQHPLLEWMRRINDFRRAHANSKQGKIFVAPMTGVVRAFLGLSYDLYLSAHNAELPPLLMKRLRNAKTFEGALYQASVTRNRPGRRATVARSRLRREPNFYRASAVKYLTLPKKVTVVGRL